MFNTVLAANETINIVIPNPSNAPTDLGQLISSTVTFVLVISLLITFAYLVWGGIQWITSGGDKAAVEAARNRIQAAILGLFIVFGSWAVMKIIAQFFGVNFPNISFPQGVSQPTPTPP